MLYFVSIANSHTGDFVGAVFTDAHDKNPAVHAAAARVPEEVATELSCGIMAVPERVAIAPELRERLLTHQELVAYFGADVKQIRIAPELFAINEPSAPRAAAKAMVN